MSPMNTLLYTPCSKVLSQSSLWEYYVSATIVPLGSYQHSPLNYSYLLSRRTGVELSTCHPAPPVSIRGVATVCYYCNKVTTAVVRYSTCTRLPLQQTFFFPDSPASELTTGCKLSETHNLLRRSRLSETLTSC